MVTLRQHKTATSTASGHSSWSATFDSAPLAGSLLVAAVGFQNFSGSTKTVSVDNFTMVGAAIPGSAGLAVAGRLAGSSDSSTVTARLGDDTSDSSSIIIAEFTGAFNALSVSNGFASLQSHTSGSTFTSRVCPSINVGDDHLVLPLLGINGEASSPSVNLSHTFIAHARPGTQNWQRAVAAGWQVLDDEAGHAPEWSWTGGVMTCTAGQVAFPLSATVGVAVEIETAEQTPAVELGWTNNGDGPFKVIRDGSTLQSGISGTGFVDTSVTAGNQYVYRIEDDNEVQSEPETVNVTAQGVFWLRRDGSGWTSGGA